MSAHIQHTKYADLCNAVREILGHTKMLPDVFDQYQVVDACTSCPKYTGKGGRCPRHRRFPKGVL